MAQRQPDRQVSGLRSAPDEKESGGVDEDGQPLFGIEKVDGDGKAVGSFARSSSGRWLHRTKTSGFPTEVALGRVCLQRDLGEDGGTPGDWAKIRSSNFKAADANFEPLAYRNVRTGKVVVPFGWTVFSWQKEGRRAQAPAGSRGGFP